MLKLKRVEASNAVRDKTSEKEHNYCVYSYREFRARMVDARCPFEKALSETDPVVCAPVAFYKSLVYEVNFHFLVVLLAGVSVIVSIAWSSLNLFFQRHSCRQIFVSAVSSVIAGR